MYEQTYKSCTRAKKTVFKFTSEVNMDTRVCAMYSVKNPQTEYQAIQF